MGERIVRIGATSDLHFGSEDNRYPGSEKLHEGFTGAEETGVDLFAVVGDAVDRGRRGKAREVGNILAENFSGHKIAVLGNHDPEESLQELQETGIRVLDKESTVLEINGLRIGIYGQNGSLPRAYRESIRGLSWTEQMPLHQSYTRQAYYPSAEEQMNALLEQNIDMLLVLSHVPLSPLQLSDSHAHPLLEMTPEIGKYIDHLPVPLRIILSGHTHSFDNNEWGRDNPVDITESGTIVANVAYPNARRARRPMTTVLDVYRLPNGELTAASPKLSLIHIP